MLFPIVVSASSRRPPLGTVRYVTYLTHWERVRNVAQMIATADLERRSGTQNADLERRSGTQIADLERGSGTQIGNAVAMERSHVNYLTLFRPPADLQRK